MNVNAKLSPLRLQEFMPNDRIDGLPRGMRGIYVLYKYRPRLKKVNACAAYFGVVVSD